MAVTIEIDYSKQMDLAADFEKVFEVVADVPKTASLFPKVEQLVKLADDQFQWEMDKVGVSKYTIQVIYACQYDNNKEEGIITWKPVPGVGNATNEGRSILKATDNGTSVDFATRLVLDLPLPKLAKGLVKPLIVREFHQTADQFEKNLKEYLGA